MLFSIVNINRPISYVPHERSYCIWRSRLTESQRRTIEDKLTSMIDGDTVHTASWMPGRDWSGTVFQPIWEHACLKNYEAAAKCFGIMLWETMMARPESWSFGRFEKNN